VTLPFLSDKRVAVLGTGSTGIQLVGELADKAKELTVLPKRKVIVRDGAAYGLILTQGYGKLGEQMVATPSMIRFGEMTQDELFVTADAARQGIAIENLSDTDPLVLLKHFGPGNPDAERLRRRQ